MKTKIKIICILILVVICSLCPLELFAQNSDEISAVGKLLGDNVKLNLTLNGKQYTFTYITTGFFVRGVGEKSYICDDNHFYDFNNKNQPIPSLDIEKRRLNYHDLDEAIAAFNNDGSKDIAWEIWVMHLAGFKVKKSDKVKIDESEIESTVDSGAESLIGLEIKNLIGLKINSQLLQEYLNKFQVKPEISKFDDVYYYIFESEGIDFGFSNSNTLNTIFLFSEGSDNHRQFLGSIPYNIQFNDTRKDIEEKLGSPDESGGGGVINYYSIWEKKGLRITYKTIDQEDMMNRIHDIAIY